MSGLGERGKRLRRIAAELDPAPVAVFYVQLPDEAETRAIGWHMKRTREGEPVYLGHGAIAAELTLRRMVEEQLEPVKPRRRGTKAKAKEATA